MMSLESCISLVMSLYHPLGLPRVPSAVTMKKYEWAHHPQEAEAALGLPGDNLTPGPALH